MRNPFSSVASLKPRRSLFDLSYEKKFTADFSFLYPVMCDECVPGDIFKIGNSHVIRFNPLVAPVMHDINATVHYFFVPYRILDKNFELNITGGLSGTVNPVNGFPRWPYLPAFANSLNGTLWDYLGFPTDLSIAAITAFNNEGFFPTTSGFIKPVDYPRRAYGCIYSQFYLDENFYTNSELYLYLTPQGDFNLDNFDGTNTLTPAWLGRTNTLGWRSQLKDYFTTALPWQQRGITGGMPVTVSASAIFDGVGSTSPAVANFFPQVFYGNGVLNSPRTGVDNVGAIPTTAQATQSFANFLSFLNLNHVNAAASAFTVSDIRSFFQIQKWMERNARGGVRYTEFLRSHFSVSPRDERLQRPEYIGGTKSPIVISEVLQTSSSDSTSPQANMAGHGLGVSGNFVGSYHVKEFGLIMGLMSIMPKPAYEDRLDRQWIKESRYDFYFPEFAHLSEQGIYNAEIRYMSVPAQDSAIFGFQGRWDEMRFKHDQVCGLFRVSAPGSLAVWHCGRHFTTPPPLGLNFLVTGFNGSTEAKRILAVPSEPAFLVNFRNHITAIRPLPVYSDPGLIDHF